MHQTHIPKVSAHPLLLTNILVVLVAAFCVLWLRIDSATGVAGRRGDALKLDKACERRGTQRKMSRGAQPHSTTPEALYCWRFCRYG